MLQSILRRFNITSAILWSLANATLMAVSGPVVAALVVRNLNSEGQGYYYTFSSLLALSVFLELGFTTCIVQFISHEFAGLTLSPNRVLAGPKVPLLRLIDLSRLSFKWFSIASLLAFFGLGFGGELFFSYRGGHDVSWRLGWWLLCFATSINLLVVALQAVLDGINQVAWNMRLRLFQSFTKSFVLIALIGGGAKLLSPGMAGMAAAAVALWGASKWIPLMRQIAAAPRDGDRIHRVSWVREMLPMQWRLAVSWASGYFIFSAFTPLIFSSMGPVMAGRFGLTWSIIQASGVVAQIFINTRAPQFGILVANGRLGELRNLWKMAFLQSLFGSFACCALIFSGLTFAHYKFPLIASRFLDISDVIPLLLATLVNQFVFSVAVLVRSEKREPFLVASVVVAVLTLIGTVCSSHYFSISGVVWSYFGSCLVGFVMAFGILKKSAAYSSLFPVLTNKI